MSTDSKSNGAERAPRDETGLEAATVEKTAAEVARRREAWLDSHQIEALRRPPAATETPEAYARRVAAARALRAGIGARDPLEAVLATQMVVSHDAAMGSLGDAQNRHLKDATRHTHLRLAAQLMSLFTRQLAALERHRAQVRSERHARALDEQARRYARERADKAAERARLRGRPVPDPADSEFEEAALDRLCLRFERRLSGKPEAAAAKGGANGAGRPAGAPREGPPGRRRRSR